jgi:hypothetical protein
MKFFPKILLLIVCFSFLAGSVAAQNQGNDISEGPYIFFKGDQVNVKWIENGLLKVNLNPDQDFLQSEFNLGLDPKVFLENMEEGVDFYQEYKNVSNLAVISDIHGQYGLSVELLKAHGIIDENTDWKYGKGHLVVNGDILGRGDMVTEVLWLVYKLEHQAEAQGGKVHFLIGNHELMFIENDFRFLNEKYVGATKLMGIRTSDLYAENAVLGNWLRKRPVIITIDDFLITHAGISPSFLQRKLTAKKVNKQFYTHILKASGRRKNTLQTFLTSEDGPLWYRGYFVEPFPTAQNLDDILDFFESKKIIVGHTSLRSITPLFEGRVIGVDSNIKEGITGEILIIENGGTFRGGKDGGRKEL